MYISSKFQVHISKYVEKGSENFSLTGSTAEIPSRVFVATREPKIANHDE